VVKTEVGGIEQKTEDPEFRKTKRSSFLTEFKGE
jgi:hypothetical protein